MKKFFKESFAIIGYIFGLVGTAVTIFTISGDITFEIRWLVILGFVFIAAVVLTLIAIAKYNKVLKNGTRFKITGYVQEKGKDIYYTDYTSNLRVGTFVSVYYTKPISKKVGIGIIVNSSADEYIEIRMLFVEDAHKDIFEQSKTNSHKVLQDMYVLPNLYEENIAEINTYLNGGKDTNG